MFRKLEKELGIAPARTPKCTLVPTLTRRTSHDVEVLYGRCLHRSPLWRQSAGCVYRCAGLPTISMQNIAREFNLSETVFIVKPPRSSRGAPVTHIHSSRELAFCGHPTIGAATCWSKRRPASAARRAASCSRKKWVSCQSDVKRRLTAPGSCSSRRRGSRGGPAAVPAGRSWRGY